MKDKHEVEILGAKKQSWGQPDTQEKRKSFHFEWNIDPFCLQDLFQNRGTDWTKSCTAVFQFQQLQKCLEKFADFAGVPADKIQFSVEYEHSYYDSVNTYYCFSVSRNETDEEYEARKVVIEEAKKKAAKTREKNKVQKIENEKKELERLLKKYGSEVAGGIRG